jgi:hypothetical protein
MVDTVTGMPGGQKLKKIAIIMKMIAIILTEMPRIPGI